MRIYVSRRDENVTAKLDEAYSNEHTVMLEYLTGDKKGKTTSITHSTLKRWWKAVEVKDTVEEIDETDTNLELLVSSDSKEQAETLVEEYAKIGLEIAEQAKEKARKHKNNKVDNSDKLYELELLLNNLDSKYYESVRCYKIKAEGKTIAEVYPQKKGIRVYVHKDYDISNVCVIKDNYKYYLPVAVNFDYDNISKVMEFLNRK